MNKTSSNDLNLAAEAVECLFRNLIGRLLYCEKTNGKTFAAKLVDIAGGYLIFETRDGRRNVDRATDIVCMNEIPGGAE